MKRFTARKSTTQNLPADSNGLGPKVPGNGWFQDPDTVVFENEHDEGVPSCLSDPAVVKSGFFQRLLRRKPKKDNPATVRRKLFRFGWFEKLFRKNDQLIVVTNDELTTR